MAGYDSHGTPFLINSDLILWVSSIAFTNTNSFASTTSAVHNFSILAGVQATVPACPNSAAVLSFSNESDFAPTLNTLIDSYGSVDFSNDLKALYGQIVANCSFTTSNGFSLSFVPTAALGLPWTNAPSLPEVSVTQKIVLSG